MLYAPTVLQNASIDSTPVTTRPSLINVVADSIVSTAGSRNFTIISPAMACSALNTIWGFCANVGDDTVPSIFIASSIFGSTHDANIAVAHIKSKNLHFIRNSYLINLYLLFVSAHDPQKSHISELTNIEIFYVSTKKRGIFYTIPLTFSIQYIIYDRIGSSELKNLYWNSSR